MPARAWGFESPLPHQGNDEGPRPRLGEAPLGAPGPLLIARLRRPSMRPPATVQPHATAGAPINRRRAAGAAGYWSGRVSKGMAGRSQVTVSTVRAPSPSLTSVVLPERIVAPSSSAPRAENSTL